MNLQNAGIFSAFNSLDDLTLKPEFGSLLGFTEAELHRFFEPFLEASASAQNCSTAELVQSLKRRYDGFCFESSGQTHVFAPWSVLNFFLAPERFQNFWFDSAGHPAYLINCLKKQGILNPASFDNPPPISINDLASSDDVSCLKPEVLLVHSGYLTIKKSEGQRLELGYPNEEVRSAMARIYSESFWPDLRRRDSLAKQLTDALLDHQWQAVLHALNAVVKQLDYQHFPLKDEASVVQLMQVFCLGADIPVRVEVHGSRGRSDLELAVERPSERAEDFVFEFKYAKAAGEAERLAAAAAAQIRSRDYGIKRKGRKLMRLAVVFDGPSRRFVRMENADECGREALA